MIDNAIHYVVRIRGRWFRVEEIEGNTGTFLPNLFRTYREANEYATKLNEEIKENGKCKCK